MYMRYRGGGIGHYNIVIPLEDEPVGGEDEEDLDELDPPVPDKPEIPPTPPGALDPADTPLPSSLSTNSSSSDSSVQSGLTGAGLGGESDEEPGSVVDNLGPEDGDGDVEEEVEEGYAPL